MNSMTDREIIRAEIERRMKCFKNERNTITKASDNNLSLGARIAMCEEILSFIDSLQEEPVSEDLEEVSKKYALNNTPWDDCADEMQEAFKAGAKWQKEHYNKYAKSSVLSGGQLQRVSIARSLACESKVILLDEATGALDIKMKREVQNIILKIISNSEKTILNVTHSVEEAYILVLK